METVKVGRYWPPGFDPEVHSIEDYYKFQRASSNERARKERARALNRKRLREDNEGLIRRNTTPSVDGMAVDPAEICEARQAIEAKVRAMSPLLRIIFHRTFIKDESVSDVAKDLGTTEAAVNMARTRIKQHINGV